MKWGFLPAPDDGPRYLVVNADESEPGTCKDIPLMMADPHLLIEGTIVTALAIGCHRAFIYVRGEVLHVYRRMLEAVAEARRRATWAATSSARGTSWRSWCTRARGRTSAVRRRRCSTPSRAGAASPD